uniref:PepSY domain-containing protein n=1 Tax=Sphingomonas bacterium TaxID=1895847 RepID=UPI0026249C16|nr:PepSY domain-containing protein [Sphingomonas bacterium]
MSACDAMNTIGHRAKRWLYIVHRWIGIASCLLFAMWFLSGLVMIYVPFPALDRSERLEGSPAIDWSLVHIPPGPAVRVAALDAPPRAFLLEMRGGAPVWRITTRTGEEISISASSGRRLGLADAAEARRTAELFGRARVMSLTSIDRDQWTVPGSFDRHRPLWKASLTGAGGRVLYVSSKTGAVVLDTNLHERFWNWLGSVPHWLYPTVLRQDNALWRQVVMWVSGPCILAAVTGFWIGILRTRLGRRRFKGGRVTPYRGWMEWHHVAGLTGGLFLIAWIFSGWLSVDPGRLFASGGIDPAARDAYEDIGAAPTIDPENLARVGAGAKQVALRWLAGRPLLVIDRMSGTTVLAAATLQPIRLDRKLVTDAASRLVPGGGIVAVDRLQAPDAYWYEVGARPLLPVLRLRFDDPAKTWVHIDPATGAILGDIDARGRLYRWLFDLLHKWDLNLLTLHRPIWDVLLWILSVLGLVTSISGVRIGWIRLMRSPSRR